MRSAIGVNVSGATENTWKDCQRKSPILPITLREVPILNKL
jgi:hypothetical protein